MCNQTEKVFLSGKRDLKQCKRLKEIKRNPKQTRLFPSGVASSVVKESILWLGFKRPSTYWG